MKNLALDIGNVLCRVDFDPFRKLLSRTVNISNDEIDYFLNRTQKFHDLGITTVEEELIDRYKIKSNYLLQDLNLAWNKCVIPDKQVIEFFSTIREAHNIKIALLSNIGTEHALIMKSLLKGLFDESILHFSCFVGARKPTDLYYQSFISKYPDFSNCVYVDDLDINLNAGRKFGFTTFNFNLEFVDNTMLDLQKIEKLILEVP